MHVKGNFAYLLISLLGFLVLTAFLAQYPTIGGDQVLMFLIEGTLIVGIWSLVQQRFWFVFGLILIAIGAINIILEMIIHHSWAHYVNLIVALSFYLFTTVIAFRALLTGNRIDLNMLMGSICVYILVGISWSIFYYFESVIHPGAFKGITADSGKQQFTELLYYSYVTLSTLGYGDVTPVTPIARTLAYLEALFGQFYIAILVASFVGMHIARSHKDTETS
ncbi:MAG: ion channel [Gammaproteobacteria bacterium]|nr:ion channel [Gammaproteobacteria bacterium]